MKKFFALVLAVAMVMSLAAVSFAAQEGTLSLYKGVPGEYSADANEFRPGKPLEYGETAYFLIGDDADEDTPDFITDYAHIEKMKVKATYEMGADLVESVSIVKKKVDNIVDWTDNKTETAVGEYVYFIAVKVASKKAVADADIIGTFEFTRKADADNKPVAVEKVKDLEIDFEINVFYDDVWYDSTGAKTDLTIEGDDVTLKWEEHYAVKFDYDDEVEFSFGSEPNEGTFTVDVSGQGKLYMWYDTVLDNAIAEANPGVKIHALNFTGLNSPVYFNRTGEFCYEMEDGVAAYKVVDGQLVAIPGCEYDEGDEAFYFNTRALESYVFANAELVNPVVDAPVVEVEPAPEVTNPSTGA